MKAALLKEFYLWKATRLKLLLIGIFFNVFWTVTKSTAPTILSLFVMIASAAACFSEDKKTGWTDYSRCLPNTAAQRVTAKYIFALSEVMTGVLLSLGSSLQASYYAGLQLGIVDVYYGRTFANHLIYIVLLAVGFSVLVPLSYKLKPKKGEKVNYVLFVVYFLGIAVAGGFVLWICRIPAAQVFPELPCPCAYFPRIGPTIPSTLCSSVSRRASGVSSTAGITRKSRFFRS